MGSGKSETYLACRIYQRGTGVRAGSVSRHKVHKAVIGNGLGALFSIFWRTREVQREASGKDSGATHSTEGRVQHPYLRKKYQSTPQLQ